MRRAQLSLSLVNATLAASPPSTNINDFENFIMNLKKKANLESDFTKLKIDLSKDYERIISGVNLLRLKNNPIHLKKSDIKTILLKK